MEKGDKVGSSNEGSKKTSVCVTPHPSLKIPPPCNNKQDYKGDTQDKRLDSDTHDSCVLKKDDKVSSSIEGSKQRSVCVTPPQLLKTPPPFNNKRDYKGDTHDKTLDYSTKDTNEKKRWQFKKEPW